MIPQWSSQASQYKPPRNEWQNQNTWAAQPPRPQASANTWAAQPQQPPRQPTFAAQRQQPSFMPSANTWAPQQNWTLQSWMPNWRRPWQQPPINNMMTPLIQRMW